MSEPTKGPWRFERKPAGDLIFNGREEILAEMVNLPDGTAEANAHLIVASPDLLAACERSIKAMEEATVGDEMWFRTTLEIVRAAVAKAKGEQGDALDH